VSQPILIDRSHLINIERIKAGVTASRTTGADGNTEQAAGKGAVVGFADKSVIDKELEVVAFGKN
jgi:hypothetical protein